MKLSDKTKKILSNFATFGSAGKESSFIFEKGREQGIKNDHVYAFVELDEDFPETAPIFDLKKFLSALHLFDDPLLNFTNTKVIIKSNERELEYNYCDDAHVRPLCVPHKRLTMDNPMYSFALKESDLLQIQKTCSIFNFDMLSVLAEGGKTKIMCYSSDTPNANKYTLDIGTTTEPDFVVTFAVSKLYRFMRDEYIISFTDQLASFKGTNYGVEYFITAEID